MLSLLIRIPFSSSSKFNNEQNMYDRTFWSTIIFLNFSNLNGMKTIRIREVEEKISLLQKFSTTKEKASNAQT